MLIELVLSYYQMLSLKWKNIFGIICFALSAVLFTFVWLISKEKASLRQKEISIYNTHTDHLTDERKCSCSLLLLKMESAMFLNKDLVKYHKLFNQYCFKFPKIKNININKLKNDFDPVLFAKIHHQTMWQSINFKLDGNSDNSIKQYVNETKEALYHNKLQAAYDAFDQIPENTLSAQALAWKRELDYLISHRALIRLAVCKLLTPKMDASH